MRGIDQIREAINGIDRRLLELLNERASLAKEIGDIKGRDGKPFFTPEREREIYDELARSNPGPLEKSQLTGIFREIISAARAAEKALNVAFWGPAGTFSYMAAVQAFGSSSNFDPCDSIAEAFEAVERGHANYGVVPVENAVAGVVPETLDMFPMTNVKICAELYVPVQHHLVSLATDLASIERVFAGPQPAAQCRRWLRENLPAAEVVDVAPTAKAAERALEDPRSAAIANRVAAELVGVSVLVESIHDNPHNSTRFLIIGENEPGRTGRDKTSLMFNLRNEPGELYRALGALYENQVNLSMIESRPAPRVTFEYMFFCDCAGHRSDANVAAAITQLRGLSLKTTVLGSYPSAEIT